MKFNSQRLPTMIAATIAAKTSATQTKLARLIGAPIGSTAAFAATLMRGPQSLGGNPRAGRGAGEADMSADAGFLADGRGRILLRAESQPRIDDFLSSNQRLSQMCFRQSVPDRRGPILPRPSLSRAFRSSREASRRSTPRR